MSTKDIEPLSCNGNEDAVEVKPRTRASPEGDYLRKRRERSNSVNGDEGIPWSSHSEPRCLSNDRAHPPFTNNSPMSGNRHHHRDHAELRPAPSPLTNSDGTSGSSRELQEDSLTVRRREANRLAAQRFRSRKKGYQDSLEEKVRQLEEDKELLIRRLTDVPGMPSIGRSTPANRYADKRVDGMPFSRSGSSGLTQPTSPEHRDAAVDIDVRVSALESANRRLQDELRAVNEENDKLREELGHWKRWDREQRGASWAIDMARRDERRVHDSPRSGAELVINTGLTQHERRGQTGTYPPPTVYHANLTPSNPHLPLHSPTEGSHPPPPSPGFRLPPIRLPPLQSPVSLPERATSSGGPTQYLPRATELDSVSLGLLPPPGRQSGLPGDDRRRGE